MFFFSDVLLPLVHKLWAPLLPRFTDQEMLVILKVSAKTCYTSSGITSLWRITELLIVTISVCKHLTLLLVWKRAENYK